MLLLPSVRPQDAGTYVCTATNRQGKVKAFAHLQVPGKTTTAPGIGSVLPAAWCGLEGIVSNCILCWQSGWCPTSHRPPTPSCRCPPSRMPTGSLRSRSPSGLTQPMVSRREADLRGGLGQGISWCKCYGMSPGNPQSSPPPSAVPVPQPPGLSSGPSLLPPLFSIPFSDTSLLSLPWSLCQWCMTPVDLSHLPIPVPAPSPLLFLPPLNLSSLSLICLLPSLAGL